MKRVIKIIMVNQSCSWPLDCALCTLHCRNGYLDIIKTIQLLSGQQRAPGDVGRYNGAQIATTISGIFKSQPVQGMHTIKNMRCMENANILIDK